MAIAVPGGKSLILNVGLLTEKCPFAEVRVIETLKVAYVAVLTSFWMTTRTVFDSPKFNVDGIWFPLSSSRISRY